MQHSNDWEEHLTHIRSILQRLREAGLTVKPRKCQLAMGKCSYLGHIVGDGIIQPEKSKLEAVKNYPTPTTKKRVRVFLGLTGYYRKFIPAYANLAVTLTDLTRKSAPTRVRWTSECEKAFQSLKEALCSRPILRSPDLDKEFILQTDASDRGVGAVLSQFDID